MNPKEWNDYLTNIKDPGVSILANLLWDILGGYALPTPTQAGPYEDNTGFEMVWNKDEHHLDITIDQFHNVEWFYCNRNTNQTDGGENDLGAMMKYVELIG